MQQLATVDVHIKDIFNGSVRVAQWTRADPFPQMGPCVGVDTETELITETNSAPPLVVLGVFDPQSATCYISYWEDAAVFINWLSKQEIRQVYFNLGFDEHVLNDVDTEKALMDSIEYGRVRDMQIRVQLHDIATKGFIPYNHYSLEDCSRLFLGIQLDKGEKDDPESHRLTFRRGTPITQEQAIYLCWDCVSTFALSTAVPEQPTEVAHSKGMVVLAHITYNGFDVDPLVYKAFEDKLQAAKDEYRNQLLTFGFPDPYRSKQDENGDYKRFVEEQTLQFLELAGVKLERPLNLCKGNMRMALLYMFNFSGEPDEIEDFEQSVGYWLTQEKPKNIRKVEKPVFDAMMDEYRLDAFFDAGKEIVMNALLGHVMEDLIKQQGTKRAKGYDLGHAIEYASDIIDDNPHWTSSEKQVGPKTFLQQHYKNLLDNNPGLELPTTDGGDYKLTLNDKWRLDDMGIKDPFLDVYTKYRHMEKFKSTFFNHEDVKADGKVHPRYTSLLRTGRTSANKPVIQIIPSRDPVWTIKNMFAPPKGAILCATDFSYVELCGFAQSCIDRFGHSVMADVINAGIDPHRWFAGVMNKLITPDLSNKDDPEWVAKTNAFLEEHVTKKQRQDAKAKFVGPHTGDCMSKEQ